MDAGASSGESCVSAKINMVVEQNKMVTLATDIFFVDGIVFLLTLSRQIKFIMGEHVANHKAKSPSKHKKEVIQVYVRAGFNVHTVLMDKKFKKVKDEPPLVLCNTMVATEHVSKAKRCIWTIQERTREIIGTLPFEHIPQRLKMEFMYFVVLRLNAIPVKTGVSGVYLP